MFGRHFQSSADMPADQFPRILLGCLIRRFILAAIDQQIIADTAADETALDARQTVYGMIHIEQFAVVRIEVRTYLRMNATGPATLLTCFEITTMHAIHIGRRAAESERYPLKSGISITCFTSFSILSLERQEINFP